MASWNSPEIGIGSGSRVMKALMGCVGNQDSRIRLFLYCQQKKTEKLRHLLNFSLLSTICSDFPNYVQTFFEPNGPARQARGQTGCRLGLACSVDV